MQRTPRFAAGSEASPAARAVSSTPARGVSVISHYGAEIPVDQAIWALGEPQSPTELGQRLGVAVAMVWPNIRHADLFVPHASGTLRGVCDAGAGEDVLTAFRSTLGTTALGEGLMPPIRPMLVPGEAWRGMGPTMSAPVFSSSALEGFILVQRFAGLADFTPRCLEALTALASGVGELLPKARSRAHKSMSAWLAEDMASAREVQRALLPSSLNPNSAGVRAVAEYLPAFAVGGDFYDLIDLGDGRLIAAIGDVTGKGVTAALTMARVSAELRRLAPESSGPADLLTQLSRSVPARMQDDRFATVVCVQVDVPRRRWTVANAGHVLPILRRKNGEVTLIGIPSGLPIGITQTARYQEEAYTTSSQDILILATDGAFEGLSGPRKARATIGHSRLTQIVEEGPHDVAELGRRIVSSAISDAGGSRDDVALLGLQLAETVAGPGFMDRF